MFFRGTGVVGEQTEEYWECESVIKLINVVRVLTVTAGGGRQKAGFSKQAELKEISVDKL